MKIKICTFCESKAVKQTRYGRRKIGLCKTHLEKHRALIRRHGYANEFMMQQEPSGPPLCSKILAYR